MFEQEHSSIAKGKNLTRTFFFKREQKLDNDFSPSIISIFMFAKIHIEVFL